jgi:thiamine biosynthesis lipoprotein
MNGKTDITPKTARLGRETFAWLLAAALIGLLVVIGLYKHESIRSMIPDKGELESMATTYNFTVLVEGNTSKAEQAMEDAKKVAEDIGWQMSTHLTLSALNEFNNAEAHVKKDLPFQIMEVLRASQRLNRQTGGAFDVTILPIIRLYRQAAEDGKSPTDAMIEEARQASTWEDIQLFDDGTAMKLRSSAGVDLGGIAKGYAIDKALEVIQEAQVAGAMVEIGGDLRVYGASPGGQAWRVMVQDPFKPEDENAMFCRLAVNDRAVCTSGNYHRSYVIGQTRYSHIIDPIDPRRKTADRFPASVTVVAPTAMDADAWATALSVLGDKGLLLVEQADGVEAMLVYGTPEKPETLITTGFGQYFIENERPPGLVQPEQTKLTAAIGR